MADASSPGDLKVLRVARLFDGQRELIREQVAVAIEGRLIGQICAQQEFSLPEGTVAEEFDFPEATLLPGLVDAHSHTNLPGDGSTIEEVHAAGDDLHLLQAVRNARTALESGVTTLADAGGWNHTVLSLREGIQRGLILGPEILAAGRPITITGGHCWMMGGQADGEDGVRRMVRRLVQEGVDFIKVMASGGGTLGTLHGRSSYTPRELKALVDEAHRHERRVIAHALASESIVDALEAGVDGLGHCMFLKPDGTVDVRPDVAARIASQGVWVSPTLYVLEAHLLDLEKRRREGHLSAQDEAGLQQRRQQIADHAGNCRLLLSAGVHIVAGSDCGWRNYPFGQFHHELDALVRYTGMSARQALWAGTQGSATALGVSDRVGTIVTGKQADLLVVRGDPTEDLDALANVLAVFKGGARIR